MRRNCQWPKETPCAARRHCSARTKPLQPFLAVRVDPYTFGQRPQIRALARGDQQAEVLMRETAGRLGKLRAAVVAHVFDLRLVAGEQLARRAISIGVLPLAAFADPAG